MNIRNIITKIFSLTLIFGVIFFGMGFVEASCPSLPAGCSTPNGYDFECRVNPTTLCWSQGCERDSEDERFNNNAVNDSGVMNAAEISSYDSFIGYYGGGIGDSSAVRFLQEKINIASTLLDSCSPICEDGRFGNETIDSLESCIPCLSNQEQQAIRDGDSFFCQDGEPDVNGCCIETDEIFCTTTISGPNTYTEGENIDVIIIYEAAAEDPYDSEDFIVAGGSILDELCIDMLEGKMECSLTITPDPDTVEVTIESPVGAVKYNSGDILCPAKDITIVWDEEFVDCEDNDSEKPLTGDNNDCSDYGLGRTSNNVCCKRCDKAPNVNSGQNCEQTYGSGRDLSAGGCCEFDCPKNPADAPEGKKLNTGSCERICDPSEACCGIQLNTVVPFIGDCIEMTTQNSTAGANGNTSYVNQLNAFPFLMMGLSKILVTVILIFSFLVVIAAGLMMVTGVYEEGNYTEGLKRIKKVIVALILLGSSGLILKLINPTFFGG